jgi:hypothetical protein
MFTKLGGIVSVIAICLGLVGIVGWFVAVLVQSSGSISMGSKQATLWLNQGSTLLFLGLVLGVLCEISKKLDK